jgi:hypothetical protein
VLTKQGNTQVYSPFGTYVVEQHDQGFDQPQRSAVPEPPFVERTAEPTSAEPEEEMPKAA